MVQKLQDKLRFRKGVIILESLVVIVILVVLTIAVFQFAILQIAHQAVNAAAMEGARVACRASFGTSTQQAVTEAAVIAVLEVNGVEASNVDVTVTDSASSVKVDITVPLDDLSVPNWLANFGFSTGSMEFRSVATGWK